MVMVAGSIVSFRAGRWAQSGLIRISASLTGTGQCSPASLPSLRKERSSENVLQGKMFNLLVRHNNF